jgi:hypothetical protein
VVTLVWLLFAASEIQLMKDASAASGWKLLRDGKRVETLRADEVRILAIDTEWREAVRKVRRMGADATPKQLWVSDRCGEPGLWPGSIGVHGVGELGFRKVG